MSTMDAALEWFVRLVTVLFAIGWIGALLVIVVSLIQTAAAVLQPDPPAGLDEPTLPPTSEHL